MAKPAASAFNPPIGTPLAIQFLPVELLEIDPSYQRSIESRVSQRLIESIATGWDWRLCTPLLVSSRDGKLFVIDGQHRLCAAKRRGDIPHLPCGVSAFASPAEEAALFVRANRRRKTVNRLDDFRAAVIGGEAAAVTIQRLIDEAGLRVARLPNPQNFEPGELACLNGLRTALKLHGEAVVAKALATIAAAFGDQVLLFGGTIFTGLAKLFAAQPEVDLERLTRALRTRTAAQWGDHPLVRAERGGDQRQKAFRKAVLAVYEQLAASSPRGGHGRSFEQQMEAVKRGAGLVEKPRLPDRRFDNMTLGGVGSGML